MSDAASIDRQIRDLIPQWLDAVRRKDAAAIAQFYAPSGRFMVPNAPIAEGREAIAGMWGHLLSRQASRSHLGRRSSRRRRAAISRTRSALISSRSRRAGSVSMIAGSTWWSGSASTAPGRRRLTF